MRRILQGCAAVSFGTGFCLFRPLSLHPEGAEYAHCQTSQMSRALALQINVIRVNTISLFHFASTWKQTYALGEILQ